jgi:hypothetical protein
MLPPFIIEKIRRREQEEARQEDRPFIEVPMPPPRPRPLSGAEGDEANRGVIVIDLG